MSRALYDNLAGLRFWEESKLEARDSITRDLVHCVNSTLRGLNQMWRLSRIETPLMMPAELMSGSYTRDDVFYLQDPPGGTNPYVLRPETTNGTYMMAEALIRDGEIKAPCGLWQCGPSFRRELSDGATAGKLRFNQFNQLEFQLIYSQDTKVDLISPLRENLLARVKKITGRESRLIESDRLPSYSEETVDIEVLTDTGDWREVASTSKRTDFPLIAGSKPLQNFEIAFGIDRMVAMSEGL